MSDCNFYSDDIVFRTYPPKDPVLDDIDVFVSDFYLVEETD